jgi:hypothetical protein
VGSLSLQPAALHLPFKVTWASGSLHKPDLLLDPRMDTWGQGTFTLVVSRLYRRAIRISYEIDLRMAASPIFRVGCLKTALKAVQHQIGEDG